MAGFDVVTGILKMVKLPREGLRSENLRNSEEYKNLRDRRRLGIMVGFFLGGGGGYVLNELV